MHTVMECSFGIIVCVHIYLHKYSLTNQLSPNQAELEL